MTPSEQLRERLLGYRPGDVLWGWLGPILVAGYAGILRFVRLGEPDTLVFDETYYVKQAWSLLQFGHERRVLPDLAAEDASPAVDEVFASGNPHVFGPVADFVVHPPVGKWVIAAGQWLFGVENAFSWRVAVAVLGTLSVLMIARTARRMFGSTVLGVTAGLLLAVDGQHFVHSRTGLLDMSVMFFALGGFCALVVDRDRSRQTLAAKVGALRAAGAGPGDRLLRYGPWLGWRPWRFVAAVSLGLCIGTKWSGLYFLAVFGLMSVWWDLGARRAAGIRCWWRSTLLREAPQAAATMVGTASVVYLGTWVGWFTSSGGWDRQWAATNPAAGPAALVPDALRSLWHYHGEMWRFHVALHSPHPYMSNPWSWILQTRPTSFYYQGPKRGEPGCTVDRCSATIIDLGNPAIWWAAAAVLPIIVLLWALRRDWRAGAILAGFAAGYLPWFAFQERTIYTFYSVAFVPWVVLAVVYALGLLVGPAGAPLARRRRGLILAGTYVGLAVAVFVFFYPLYTAEVIPIDHRGWRIWFPSWI